MLANQLLINKKQRRGPARSPGITLWVEVDVKRRLTGSSKVTTSINPIFQTPTQSKNPTQKRPINKVFVKKMGRGWLGGSCRRCPIFFGSSPLAGKRFLVKNASDLLPIMGTLVSHRSPLTLATDANLNNQHGTEAIFHPNKTISCQCFPGNSRKEEMRAGRYIHAGNPWISSS